MADDAKQSNDSSSHAELQMIPNICREMNAACGRSEFGLFNLDKLAKDVEQLWAEATRYEAEGESITLQQDLWPAAEEVRAERLFENPYQATLAEHFSHSTFVTSTEVWSRLTVPEERRKKASRYAFS
jgi:hypothetical protein